MDSADSPFGAWDEQDEPLAESPFVHQQPLSPIEWQSSQESIVQSLLSADEFPVADSWKTEVTEVKDRPRTSTAALRSRERFNNSGRPVTAEASGRVVRGDAPGDAANPRARQRFLRFPETPARPSSVTGNPAVARARPSSHVPRPTVARETITPAATMILPPYSPVEDTPWLSGPPWLSAAKRAQSAHFLPSRASSAPRGDARALLNVRSVERAGAALSGSSPGVGCSPGPAFRATTQPQAVRRETPKASRANPSFTTQLPQ
ncbi:hypothetical protein T484DRAFT_1911257, partial [Baffinella frigidus]